MGSQKTKTKSQETATTTPNLNAAAPLVENYYTGLGNLSPDALKMPTNDLQKGLYAEGMGLLGKTGLDTVAPAIGMLGGVQMAGLTQAQTPAAYTPVNATAATAQMPGAYTPTQAATADYGPVAMAGAPDLPTVGSLDTSGILGGISAGGVSGARALQYINDYMNPYTEQVINANEADLRQSQGEDMASYVRQGALNGAFGGSGYALGKTNLIDAQNRTRNTMGANMRRQGWMDAAGLASGDADRSNAAGIASANNATQASIAKANLGMDGLLAEYGARNEMNRLGYQTLADLFKTNAGFLNDASGRKFDAANSMAQFNTSQANDAAGRIYSTNADMAQFNAGNQQQANLANAGYANDALGRQYSTNADMAQFNAGAANQNAQFNSGLNLDKAQTLGGLLTTAGNLDLSRLGAIGDIANSQQQIDLYNSPAGQAQLLAALINGGGLLGAQTGQTINTSGTSTSKQSGGLGSALLGGLFSLGAGALGNPSLFK